MGQGEHVLVGSVEPFARIAAANRLSRRWVDRADMRIDDEILRQPVQNLIAQAILAAGELHRGERCDRQTVRRALIEIVEQGLHLTTGIGKTASDSRSDAIGCASCGGMVVVLAITCLQRIATA
jgi:hypothetical protein